MDPLATSTLLKLNGFFFLKACNELLWNFFDFVVSLEMSTCVSFLVWASWVPWHSGNDSESTPETTRYIKGHGRQLIIPLPFCYKPVSLYYLGPSQWVIKFGDLSPERLFIQGICLASVSSASLSKSFWKTLSPFLNKEYDNKPR